MPNYYSEGDWYELPDDTIVAKTNVSVIKALVNPTFAQVVTAAGKTQSKPASAFTRK